MAGAGARRPAGRVGASCLTTECPSETVLRPGRRQADPTVDGAVLRIGVHRSAPAELSLHIGYRTEPR